jgi:hypothetical protein
MSFPVIERGLSMQEQARIITSLPDSAAQFASALSLWQTWKQDAFAKNLDIGECYGGMDQLMREVVRVANQFEAWACLHVDFDQLDDVWPYLLEERFGEACLAVLPPNALAQFDDSDCLRVGVRMGLPIKGIDETPLSSIDMKAPNPIAGSPFREYRIQTARNSTDGEFSAPYTSDDYPYDDDFSEPYLRLFGVSDEGVQEHIADRANYREVLNLVRRLAPGVEFPQVPT